MKPTVLISPGHGGILPNGKYSTAPNFDKNNRSTWHKLWHFPEEDITIFEGQINRLIAHYLQIELNELGINSIDVVASHEDVSLRGRVSYANSVYSKQDCIYVSLHCNAFPPKESAKGLEIFTSPGKTPADKLASCIGTRFQNKLNNINYRFDYSDGDLDKEAYFYELTHTAMPAVLIEYGFMTNLEEAKKLLSSEYQKNLAYVTALGIKDYLI